MHMQRVRILPGIIMHWITIWLNILWNTWVIHGVLFACLRDFTSSKTMSLVCACVCVCLFFTWSFYDLNVVSITVSYTQYMSHLSVHHCIDIKETVAIWQVYFWIFWRNFLVVGRQQLFYLFFHFYCFKVLWEVLHKLEESIF